MPLAPVIVGPTPPAVPTVKLVVDVDGGDKVMTTDPADEVTLPASNTLAPLVHVSPFVEDTEAPVLSVIVPVAPIVSICVSVMDGLVVPVPIVTLFVVIEMLPADADKIPAVLLKLPVPSVRIVTPALPLTLLLSNIEPFAGTGVPFMSSGSAPGKVSRVRVPVAVTRPEVEEDENKSPVPVIDKLPADVILPVLPTTNTGPLLPIGFVSTSRIAFVGTMPVNAAVPFMVNACVLLFGDTKTLIGLRSVKLLNVTVIPLGMLKAGIEPAKFIGYRITFPPVRVKIVWF